MGKAPRSVRAAISARANRQRAQARHPQAEPFTVHGKLADYRMAGRPDAHTYTVELHRSDEFPLDMLRHDESGPATAEDRVMLTTLTMDLMAPGRDVMIQALPKLVRVKLVTTDRLRAPNIARWASFGIKVVESDNPYSIMGRYLSVADEQPAQRKVWEGTLLDWNRDDGGISLSAQIGNGSQEADPHMFVELRSYDVDKKHPTLQAFAGKRVRVTVEVLGG